MAELEDSNFEILSQLERVWVTAHNIKYWCGEGTENLIDLGELSQSGLDLALGRGGDKLQLRI